MKTQHLLIFVLILILTSCTYKQPLGPGGGYVFYDKGEYSDGWRYLEAAPEETEWDAEWGASGKIGGTSSEIGTGKTNTQIIVAWLNAHGESGRAAQLCDALEYGGYDDWFLPSKDELDLLYNFCGTYGVGGFADDEYWSSSEYSADLAWAQEGYYYDGSSGFQHYHNKKYAKYVRAVRAF